MTIRKLHFFAPAFVGSVVRSCDTTTHDIRVGGPGYIVVERRSGSAFAVHAASCTAHVDMDDEEEKPGKKGKAA